MKKNIYECDRCKKISSNKNDVKQFDDHLFYAGENCYFRMSSNNSQCYHGYIDLCNNCAIILLENALNTAKR